MSGWLSARGTQSDSIALRWQQIGLYLAQQEPPTAILGGPVVEVCVLYDERHAEMLREGLMNASHRLLVTSHKLNRSATGTVANKSGKLDWLAKRQSNPEFKCEIVVGKHPKHENWSEEDQTRLETLASEVNATVRFEDKAHSRVLVYDDIAVVSSYNFLSSTRDKRQVGVMLRDRVTADLLWNQLKFTAARRED
jgi:hypothetical protein